jgi:hypothetical protein
MKGKKHTPEQIIGKLREADAELNGGATIGQVCQKLGISEPRFIAGAIFETLRQARALATHWRLEYNHRRPHSSLDYQTPAAFAAVCVPHPPLHLAALGSVPAAERTPQDESLITLS